MARKIYSGSSQYVPENVTNRQIHTKPGKVYSIIASNAGTAATIFVLHDSLTTGNVLFVMTLAPGQTIHIDFPQNIPLVFATGLQASTNPGETLFLITETEI